METESKYWLIKQKWIEILELKKIPSYSFKWKGRKVRWQEFSKILIKVKKVHRSKEKEILESSTAYEVSIDSIHPQNLTEPQNHRAPEK